MTSAFDPTEFLDAPTSTVNERRAVVPVENPDTPDGLYVAMIGQVEMACGLISKGDRMGQPWLQAVVPLELQLTPTLQQTHRDGPSHARPDARRQHRRRGEAAWKPRQREGKEPGAEGVSGCSRPEQAGGHLQLETSPGTPREGQALSRHLSRCTRREDCSRPEGVADPSPPGR